MMAFTITEAEVIRLTGYSRQQLQRFRLGSKQVQAGKTYEASPVLVEDQDWKRYGGKVDVDVKRKGGAVLYAPRAVTILQARRELA